MNNKIKYSVMGILLLSLMIMNINLARADWNDVKYFDETGKNYGTIKIKDWILFNKAEYRLLDYDNSLINAWAEGEYILYKKTHLFQDVYFKDLLGKEGQLKDVKFYIWKEENTTNYNPIYESKNCYMDYTNITGNEICEQVLVSNESYITDTSHWIPYEKGAVLEEGKGYWRIETTKPINKKIDFILEAQDKKLTEWAWWNESWLYKREINLTSNIGNISFINITYNAHMQTDFDDIRFLNYAEDQEYNFTLRDKVNGSWATFSVVNYGDDAFWVYYGNSLVSTTSSYNNVYYSPVGINYFDDTSGTSATGSLSGTVTGTTLTDGVMGNALDFTADADMVNYAYDPAASYATFTGQIMVKMTSATGTGHFWYNRLFGSNGAVVTSSGSPFDNGWHILYFTRSGTTLTLWVDGVYQGSSSGTINGLAIYTTYPTTNRFNWFSQVSTASSGLQLSGTAWKGQIDEYFFWNKVLTNDQILFLSTQTEPVYTIGDEETGTGTITVSFVTPPTPVNYANISEEQITVEVNPTYTNSSLTNISYDFYNVNGTLTNFFFTNETYQINVTLPEAHFHYNVTVCGNETITDTVVCGSTETRHLNHDVTAPEIIINSPLTEQITLTLPNNVTLNATSTDDALSSCWYHTNENLTNITYTCNTTTEVSFSTEGDKIIYVYANDTFGNIGQNSTSFLLNYVRRNATYEQPAIEGTSTVLYLNLTATDITSFNGSLYWNGTEYSATATNNGTYGILTTGLTLPSTTANENVSLYWNYWLNGINYNSSTYYQSIYYLTPITLSASCNDKALRFNIQNEQNLTSLTGNVNYNFKFGTPENSSYKEVYGTLSSVSTFYLCINASASQNYTLGYGELDYEVSNYERRKYYLWEDQVISNNTLTNHTLNSLLTTEQTSFLLAFEDTSLNVFAEKYSALWRWYPNLNQYVVVDMGKTDENGETVAHVETEDTDYRVGLYEQNGSLIKLGDPLRFLCTTSPCTFTLRTDAGESDYTSIYGIEADLDYNETTEVFTFVYNDPSQRTSKMTMIVNKEAPTATIQICNVTTSGYTGVLSCNTTGYTGTKKAIVYRYASPGVVFAQKVINDANTVFNSTFGLFISIFIWLAIVLSGLARSPVFVIILGVIGLIPALMTGAINLAIFTAIAVIGGIVLHFIKRASGK